MINKSAQELSNQKKLPYLSQPEFFIKYTNKIPPLKGKGRGYLKSYNSKNINDLDNNNIQEKENNNVEVTNDAVFNLKHAQKSEELYINCSKKINGNDDKGVSKIKSAEIKNIEFTFNDLKRQGFNKNLELSTQLKQVKEKKKQKALMFLKPYCNSTRNQSQKIEDVKKQIYQNITKNNQNIQKKMLIQYSTYGQRSPASKQCLTHRRMNFNLVQLKIATRQYEKYMRQKISFPQVQQQ